MKITKTQKINKTKGRARLLSFHQKETQKQTVAANGHDSQRAEQTGSGDLQSNQQNKHRDHDRKMGAESTSYFKSGTARLHRAPFNKTQTAPRQMVVVGMREKRLCAANIITVAASKWGTPSTVRVCSKCSGHSLHSIKSTESASK